MPEIDFSAYSSSKPIPRLPIGAQRRHYFGRISPGERIVESELQANSIFPVPLCVRRSASWSRMDWSSIFRAAA
jgi:hypothetical protein